MKEKLKIGIAGIGGISNAHIPAWLAIENIELIALCDCRMDQMNRYQDFHCYTDFDEMLEKEQLEVVDICLPTYLHVAFSLKALEKGIHVICEKPVSLDKNDIGILYAAAKRNHAKFMVAQCVRFWPEYQVIKELFETKKYGNLVSGSMDRLGTYPDASSRNWFCDEKLSGLVPYDLHIHDIDFMVDAFGVPDKIHSFRQKMQNQDHIHVVYEYDGFVIAADTAWYAADYAFHCGFRFQFENAVAEYEHGKLTVYLKNHEKYYPLETTEGTVSGYIPDSDAYRNEIQYFTNCVLNDQEPDRIKQEQLEAVIDILNRL